MARISCEHLPYEPRRGSEAVFDASAVGNSRNRTHALGGRVLSLHRRIRPYALSSLVLDSRTRLLARWLQLGRQEGRQADHWLRVRRRAETREPGSDVLLR